MHSYFELIYSLMGAIGVVSFAISGAMTALKKKMDLFGVLLLAFVTSFGGGLLRDLIIGRTPPSFLENTFYLLIVLSVTTLSTVFVSYILKHMNIITIFDTIGLGIFTALGTYEGFTAGFNFAGCILTGFLTATAGGMLRDIFAAEIPAILRRGIGLYATAAILGATFLTWMLRTELANDWAIMICVCLVASIRFISIKFNLDLPEVPYPAAPSADPFKQSKEKSV